MSQFYGDMSAGGNSVTRRGHKSTGLQAHVRGWNVGGRVVVAHEDGQDVIKLYSTGGSNGGAHERLVAEIKGDEVIHYDEKGEPIGVQA